jgi:hypothetical protein
MKRRSSVRGANLTEVAAILLILVVAFAAGARLLKPAAYKRYQESVSAPEQVAQMGISSAVSPSIPTAARTGPLPTAVRSVVPKVTLGVTGTPFIVAPTPT